MEKSNDPQDSNQKKDRESYEPPAIIAEEVFETLALTCGKHTGFACRISGGGLNS